MSRLFVTLGLVCGSLMPLGCDSAARDRSMVLEKLRATYGEAAIIRVAYHRDSSNLLVHLAAPAFAGLPDSVFDTTARRIASIALEQYPRAAELDSITISAVESPDGSPGGMAVRVRRERHLSVRALRGSRLP